MNFLERVVGVDRFQKFLKQYVTKFHGELVTSQVTLINYYIQNILKCIREYEILPREHYLSDKCLPFKLTLNVAHGILTFYFLNLSLVMKKCLHISLLFNISIFLTAKTERYTRILQFYLL